MEVLLRNDVDKLGRRGDVVTVKDGYARNYLLPRRLATTVNQENIRLLEVEKQRFVQEEMARKEEFQKLAGRLSNLSCTIEVNAGEEGHLYGSVTAQMVVDALKKENIELDPKAIVLDRPIKELGVYQVAIRLHPEVETTTKVWVVEARA
jgi:large subunit ribosomal protein L9